MKEAYLDNSATTQTCPEAVEKIVELLTVRYGNPSSLHKKGIEAEKEIRLARQIIADYLSCDTSEVYFTSGGTESNNLAILGTLRALKRRGNRIITTSIEHSSVIETFKEAEKLGFEAVFIEPDRNGLVPEDKIYNAINSNTILVSTMLVNNEVGTVQNVSNIKKVASIKKSPALVHIDAVQAFGKIPIKLSKINADLLTVSSHKIHGPKGVGALFVSKKPRILPIMFGGSQEGAIRPGTESSALIAGFGAAVKALPDIKDEYEHISKLNIYLRKKLNLLEGITINSPENSLPYIINFSVAGIRSETMLHHLSSLNIYVSSGSACSKGKKSHVLSSMGLSEEIIDSSIRVSFSRYNDKADIDALIDGLKLGIKNLAKRGRK